MRCSTRLSDAIHVLLFIAVDPGGDLSSAAIAASVSTHPSYVRQLMSALRRGGLLACTRGQAAPRLTRPLDRISLLDVYRAVQGQTPLLHEDTQINPECGVGMCIQHAVGDCFAEVQQAAEGAMASLSLSDVMDRFRCDGDCRCDPAVCPCRGRCGSPACGQGAAGRTPQDKKEGMGDDPGTV
ncbi:Rrf2 family transcriptional regulator [Bifidobacterium pullorum subsp. saeculare]|uniref:Rrf2 family transcriptional regulator n=1 Tax=Bifidobacterium pullorum subsp. saeculare TaxID=78257 RepID=A0A938WX06_9BIFI|nr:Rrf2 family transcriptional regulator [Bifidobacterium pullorum]MBM6699135.1 Rrf2 family transcriptional regulator [Bifidobacterium pullorum subsp. saeculare]